MKCPKCTTDLVEVHREGVMIDVCRTCHGVWLDAGELERIIKDSSFVSSPQDSYYTYKMKKYEKESEFRKKHPVLYALKEMFD